MGAFKLGKMTFGSLFKKPETVMYPIEEKPRPEGLKGHISINVDDCILCGMCERSCSTGCIEVLKQDRLWKIDRLQCVQCGYCITVCPKKCLSMDPHYAPATTTHEVDTFVIGEAEKPAKKAPAQEQPVVEAPATPKDEQLESLIALMPPESAEKVRTALQ